MSAAAGIRRNIQLKLIYSNPHACTARDVQYEVFCGVQPFVCCEPLSLGRGTGAILIFTKFISTIGWRLTILGAS